MSATALTIQSRGIPSGHYCHYCHTSEHSPTLTNPYMVSLTLTHPPQHTPTHTHIPLYRHSLRSPISTHTLSLFALLVTVRSFMNSLPQPLHLFKLSVNEQSSLLHLPRGCDHPINNHHRTATPEGKQTHYTASDGRSANCYKHF